MNYPLEGVVGFLAHILARRFPLPHSCDSLALGYTCLGYTYLILPSCGLSLYLTLGRVLWV